MCSFPQTRKHALYCNWCLGLSWEINFSLFQKQTPLYYRSPLTLAVHWTSLSLLNHSYPTKLCSQCLDAIAAPSPTWPILSRRHCALALTTTVLICLLICPVMIPNSFSFPTLPCNRPTFLILVLDICLWRLYFAGDLSHYFCLKIFCSLGLFCGVNKSE